MNIGDEKREREEIELSVPYDRDDVLGEIRRHALIEEEHYEKDAVVMKLLAEPASIEEFRRLLAA